MDARFSASRSCKMDSFFKIRVQIRVQSVSGPNRTWDTARACRTRVRAVSEACPCRTRVRHCHSILIGVSVLPRLLQILKFVCHERDEAREQMQKLLNKITPFANNPMLSDCFTIDQLHQQYQNPLMKPSKANSSIAESNSLSDAYNHCSSPVDSLFDPVTSPDLSNIKTNNSLVQDYRHEVMLSNGFHAMGSIPKIDHSTLMMESMIKGRMLPQKGNLLQAVMEAGPLLDTLLARCPLPRWQKQSQTFVDMSCASFSQMRDGGKQNCGGNILSFDDVNFSQYQGRMEAGFPRANNFGLVEKRQRFQ